MAIGAVRAGLESQASLCGEWECGGVDVRGGQRDTALEWVTLLIGLVRAMAKSA